MRTKPPTPALCLDDDRNRWWGYDFRKDYDGTPYEDYFLAVAREDYARSRAMNFAVRARRRTHR